jgi:internalin A
MTLIVAEKHKNLQKSIAVTCSAIALALCGSGLSAYAAETRSGNSRRTFADWCRQKDSLSPEAKHTVEVLLEKAETTECDEANQILSSLTELDLENYQIGDIKPLASLTNLTWIILSDNKISDIKPLASLTKLTGLYLSGNPIAPKTCFLKPESICNWEP